MAYIPTNVRQFASTHETSDEVAMAIYEVAPEGDEERMWQDPNPAELVDVLARAWELAGPDEDTLHWGNETHRREIPATANRYQTITTEGRCIEMTQQQTARYDAGDASIIDEVASSLTPGEYSVYAADGGPLLQNICVEG